MSDDPTTEVRPKYSIQDLWDIVPFGRSVDPAKPMSRQASLEVQWLINEQLLSLRPRRILEIGVASGGTTQLLCNVFPESTILGIDLTDALISDSLRNHPAFEMIIGNSNDKATKELVISKCAEFDFILIDGDHSELGVMNDFELYLPLLRSGGLAVFHDVRLEPPAGIKPTWYNIIKNKLPGAFEYFVNEDNFGYGLWYKEQ